MDSIGRFLVVFGFALLLTEALWLRTARLTIGSRAFGRAGDHHVYLLMATTHAFSFHIAPYCWRVVVPLAARSLPFDAQTDFEVIAFAAVSLTGAAVYFLVARLGFSPARAGASMVLYFSLGWATKYNLRDFWLTDGAAILFVVLALLCLLTRRWALLTLVLAVGVAVKESVIFVAPLLLPVRGRAPVGRACRRAGERGGRTCDLGPWAAPARDSGVER